MMVKTARTEKIQNVSKYTEFSPLIVFKGPFNVIDFCQLMALYCVKKAPLEQINIF